MADPKTNPFVDMLEKSNEAAAQIAKKMEDDYLKVVEAGFLLFSAIVTSKGADAAVVRTERLSDARSFKIWHITRNAKGEKVENMFSVAINHEGHVAVMLHGDWVAETVVIDGVNKTRTKRWSTIEDAFKAIVVAMATKPF